MELGEWKTYKRMYQEFNESVENSVKVSEASGEIPCTFEERYIQSVYTKFTMNLISILRITPKGKEEFWDFFSIATLTRTLMENYAVLKYFTSSNSEEEIEFKVKLAIYHWDCEKYAFYKQISDSAKEGDDLFNLKEFEDALPKRAITLENHPFFPNVAKEKRKKMLQGKTSMIYGSTELINIIDFGDYPVSAFYRYYSNIIHTTAFSTMTISEERGRGGFNEAEAGHITLALEICVMLMKKACYELVERIPVIKPRLDKVSLDYWKLK